MTGVSVSLSPLFDDRMNIVAFIERNGFLDYTGFQFYEDSCFVTFADSKTAQEFVDKIDGKRANGTTLRAEIVAGRAWESRRDSPSPRPSPRGMHSRTIAVKNYPAQYLGDRNLWEDFREIGFIREIEVRRNTGYIQFDTESDAIHAVENMNGRRLSGSRITVELIPDRILNLPNVRVPLILVDTPREKPVKEQSE
jgi:RNA recognition motif-containing protein